MEPVGMVYLPHRVTVRIKETESNRGLLTMPLSAFQGSKEVIGCELK
jgi:hypothetical protein